MLKVTFITDEYAENPDRLYDVLMRIGGYDVEIEEVEPPPTPTPARRPKAEPKSAR